MSIARDKKTAAKTPPHWTVIKNGDENAAMEQAEIAAKTPPWPESE